MRTAFLGFALLSLLAGLPAAAQTDPPLSPPVEDFKPSVLNQPGRQFPQVNSERRVRVRVVAPQAQSVTLDFLGGAKYPLTKGDDGAWTGVTRPQDEGFHYYQLVIDGAGVPDPNTLYFYGGSRWGSGVEIPAKDQDFYALKNVPHGQLRQVHFYSKSASANLRCFVYTPPDYEKDPSRRYPVLYLQHGGGEDETGWGSQGHTGRIMDNLIAAGKARPFIIVMANSYIPGAAGPGRGPAPAGQGGAAAPARPAGAAPAAGGAPAGPGGGFRFNFSAFERVLIDDLIPFVDANFRTMTDQPHRAMAGLSMGGMQTRQITLANLDKFSHIGIFSGGSIAPADVSDMDAFKQKAKVVFFSFGGRERGAASAKTNADALKQAGVNSYYYESPETGHEWQPWRRSLHQFAPLLFADLPLPPALTEKPAEAGAATPAAAVKPLAADLTGAWKSEFDSQRGRQKYTFTFKQDGAKLTGKANSEFDDGKREAELKEGKVDGDAISFVEILSIQDREIPITYTGKLSADRNEIKFTRAVGEFAKAEIVARREQSAPAAKMIRIKAGKAESVKDTEGNVWLADQGFEGGQTIERPEIQIANTKSPDLYRAERYSMESFSWPVPNGKYVVKLHFAETFEGITGPGERVFSFNVQGKEFKDFDIWVKAGGALRAYVETVNVEVTTGAIKITFTPKVENPQINAIEIIPEGASASNTAMPGAPQAIAAAAPAPTALPVAPAVPAVPVQSGPTVLKIDAGKVTGKVSPMLYGLMTEEINFAYEGGVYGELIRNRSFKADAVVPRVTPETYVAGKYLPVTFKPDTSPRYWTVVGGASMVLDTDNPLNEFLNVSLKLDASSASAAAPAGVANGGFWGIPVKPQATYRVSFFAKAAAGFTGPVAVSLESADGKTTFASAEISGLTAEWKKYETRLKTENVPASKENVFKLTTKTPGTLWLQNVSLFPPTYKNRENGNRADLMEMLGAMKPTFLRFPGGNYLEGNAFNQRFNWKETIGPVEMRPGHPSPWGYWSTDGMGLLEFAEWCEDLDMEPLLGVFAGYCLGRGGVIAAGPQLEPYVQEALEEIEYLIGDPNTTKWGAQRAKDGHPKPFKLTYVEVGNEDWFDRSGPDRTGTYDGRYAQFHDAIKKKYPHLKVISSTGYEQPQELWVKSRTPDLVDEHYYRGMEEMMAQSLKYDTYSRTNPSRIFSGEWATRVGSPTPNMAGALGDGAWMTCMERNSDIVLLSCYAPLLVNVSQLTGNGRSMQWSSDLIGYDALTSYGSPSYYAQMMFSTMVGDEILATDSQNIPMRSWQPRAGRGAPRPAQQLRQVFFSATRDSKSGIIYLKVVNTDGAAQRINIQLDGAPKIDPEGEAVCLSATSLDDTNSIEQPRKLLPRTEKVGSLSAGFAREFPPYSVTVLKLKTK